MIVSSIPSSPVTYDPSVHSSLIDEVVSNVTWQMSTDRKSTALKQLQGHIWQLGYTSGEIVSQIYDDVLPNMRKWQSHGICNYIYSSGSIGAQKLLFAHTAQGNVLDLITDHFDTTTGMKQEVNCEHPFMVAMRFVSCYRLFMRQYVSYLSLWNVPVSFPVLIVRTNYFL